jgi:MFS family permease
MTTACGLARSFWQLATARFAVGALEPGTLPSAQSLVADYFPPERRSTPVAILSMGSSAVGYLCGVTLAGYIAATRGWRTALLVAGLPGLALAVIVRLVLAEPRHQLGFPVADPHQESLKKTLSQLWRKRTYVFSLLGISISGIFTNAASIFLPSFTIRSLHATLAEVSTTWGIAVSAADLLGALIGGWLMDRLSRRDVRWYAWLPALTCALGIPLYWLALATNELWTFIGIDFMAEIVLSSGIPAAYCAVHAVCGSGRRAMAFAVWQLFSYLVGIGLGPLLAGTISDALHPIYGSESLRYSLIIMVFFLLPATLAYYWSGHSIRHEAEA